MVKATRPTSLDDYAKPSQSPAERKVKDKPLDYNSIFHEIVNVVKDDPERAGPVKDVLRKYVPQSLDKSSPMTTVYPVLNEKENYKATCVGVYNPKDNTTVVVEWEDKRRGPNKYDASKNREFAGFGCRMVVREGNLLGVNPMTGKPRDIRTALGPKGSKILFSSSESDIKEQ